MTFLFLINCKKSSLVADTQWNIKILYTVKIFLQSLKFCLIHLQINSGANHKRALRMLFTLSDIKAHDYKQFPFLSFPNNCIKKHFLFLIFFKRDKRAKNCSYGKKLKWVKSKKKFLSQLLQWSANDIK